MPCYADDDCGSTMSRAASLALVTGAGHGEAHERAIVSAVGEAEQERAHATLVLAFVADPVERWALPSLNNGKSLLGKARITPIA